MSLRFGKIYYWLNIEKVKSVVLATNELKIWKDILLAEHRESEVCSIGNQ